MVASFLRPDGDLSPEEQRAAISALAGGLRVPFGRTRQFELVVNEPADAIIQNRTANAILLLELRAISGQPAVTFLVGPTEELSTASHPEYSFPAESPVRFLVYPGEQLFAQATSGGATLLTRNEVRV